MKWGCQGKRGSNLWNIVKSILILNHPLNAITMKWGDPKSQSQLVGDKKGPLDNWADPVCWGAWIWRLSIHLSEVLYTLQTFANYPLVKKAMENGNL